MWGIVKALEMTFTVAFSAYTQIAKSLSCSWIHAGTNKNPTVEKRNKTNTTWKLVCQHKIITSLCLSLSSVFALISTIPYALNKPVGQFICKVPCNPMNSNSINCMCVACLDKSTPDHQKSCMGISKNYDSWSTHKSHHLDSTATHTHPLLN